MKDEKKSRIDPRQFTSAQRREGMRQLCLLHLDLRFNGRATGNEIANSIGKAPKHIWPRLTELAAMGRIRDTGYRVNGGRGRPQVIWALATTSPANDPLAIENESPVMRLI